MIHPGNAVVRRQKAIGIAALCLAVAFVALAGTGLIFPRTPLPDVRALHFQVGSRIVAEDVSQIGAIADAMIDAPGTIAIVTGHTGLDGDPQANLRLSASRAKVVEDLLVEAGVPDDRILTRGVAGAAPVMPEPGESAAAIEKRNKRAEVRLVERNLLDTLVFK